jgi:MATE family, multidrug efflux pump
MFARFNHDYKRVWSRPPINELLSLAWPMAVSWLSYSVMTLTDTWFVGKIGAGALAGVGLGGTMIFACACFSIGLLSGVKIMVSQAAGAKKSESNRRAYLGAGLVLASVLGAITLGIGELIADWIAGLAAGATGGFALDYLRIRLLVVPVLLVQIALREYRYGEGDSQSPMRAALLANAINIALDWLMIDLAGYGVTGAAWASVAACSVEMLFLLGIQLPHGLGLRSWNTSHVRNVLRVGLPNGIQFSLEIGSFAVLALLIAAMSEVEMAAHQIALQVIHFSFLPAYAVSEAVSVMTGQAVGADQDQLVVPVTRLGLKVTGLYTGAFTLIFALAGHWIARQFNSDSGVHLVATHLLWVAALFQVADGANMVLRGALKGTGDVRVPAMIGIVCAWALTPPTTWLLGSLAGLGALGGWLGLCLEIFLCAGLLWRRLVGTAWMSAAHESRSCLNGKMATVSSK